MQCDACGFVFLHNAPPYGLLQDELAWEKSVTKEVERRRREYPVIAFLERTTRWRLHLFPKGETRTLRRVFPPGAVLDIGCGGGAAVPQPFVPFGIEISKALAAKAEIVMKARGGHALCAPASEGIKTFPDHFFSGILLRSVLEHEMNPKPLLRECHRVLRDDGAIYIRVPNFACLNRRVMGRKWCGFRWPDHVNYFTNSSLRRMAADCGFRMHITNWLTWPLDDNLKVVLRKAGGAKAR